jgi:monothiol glutaredoxin
MSLSPELRKRLSELVKSDRILLFMKGNRLSPQCGFSATVVQILDSLVPNYTTVDVLEDPDIRAGIKDFSEWPTIPQLYIDGEFVGGCDIVREMHLGGELHQVLGLPRPEHRSPHISITDEAAQILRHAMLEQEDQHLHIAIDARFRNSLSLGPKEGDELEVEANGITMLIDRDSAARADGITLHVLETEQGPQLALSNPLAPTGVKQMSVQELKRLLDKSEPLELVDVRTPEERAKAHIEGSQRLDEETTVRLESLGKDTLLVFHCQHGGRSQAAAEHFAQRGFTNVYSLSEGIDAWSKEIDPSVPRY